MEENHEDIGRRILQQLGVQYDPRRDDGVYVALFKLNYLRGVEYTEMRSVYVENGCLHDMTDKQQRYLNERCQRWTPSFGQENAEIKLGSQVPLD